MAKRSVIQDRRLTVPLFHGTSSLHQNSIRSHGLGERDVVEELGIRNAARLLLELAADYSQDEEWLLDIHGCADPFQPIPLLIDPQMRVLDSPLASGILVAAIWDAIKVSVHPSPLDLGSSTVTLG